MGQSQDDAYAARRADLEAQFQGLPPAGSGEYWRRIEAAEIAQQIPLEALARCCRERIMAGATSDADRVFTAIMKRIQARVRQWAWSIASQAKSGMQPQLQQELGQECYMKLWEELAHNDPAFLLVNFGVALMRLQQHVAHAIMEQAGEWQRPGVTKPTRIPPGVIASIQAEADTEGYAPLEEQLQDTTAQDPFAHVELSGVLAVVKGLPDKQRAVILDRFWGGLTQEETAAKLGITPRMVRYLLTQALRELGVRLGDGEEGNGV